MRLNRRQTNCEPRATLDSQKVQLIGSERLYFERLRAASAALCILITRATAAIQEEEVTAGRHCHCYIAPICAHRSKRLLWVRQQTHNTHV
jgi:hypothetical protein